jgi:hypothetical protein
MAETPRSPRSRTPSGFPRRPRGDEFSPRETRPGSLKVPGFLLPSQRIQRTVSQQFLTSRLFSVMFRERNQVEPLTRADPQRSAEHVVAPASVCNVERAVEPAGVRRVVSPGPRLSPPVCSWPIAWAPRLSLGRGAVGVILRSHCAQVGRQVRHLRPRQPQPGDRREAETGFKPTPEDAAWCVKVEYARAHRLEHP